MLRLLSYGCGFRRHAEVEGSRISKLSFVSEFAFHFENGVMVVSR